MPKLSTLDLNSKLLIPSFIIKKFLKNEIKLKNYTINIKDDDKKKKDNNYISIGNSQYVLTKSIESMINYIISETIIDLKKGNLGLYFLRQKYNIFLQVHNNVVTLCNLLFFYKALQVPNEYQSMFLS